MKAKLCSKCGKPTSTLLKGGVCTKCDVSANQFGRYSVGKGADSFRLSRV